VCVWFSRSDSDFFRPQAHQASVRSTSSGFVVSSGAPQLCFLRSVLLPPLSVSSRIKAFYNFGLSFCRRYYQLAEKSCFPWPGVPFLLKQFAVSRSTSVVSQPPLQILIFICYQLDCVWIVAGRNRYSYWVTGLKDSRFRGSNFSSAVVFWTRPPSVRWNTCEDINYSSIRFLSSISLVVMLALLHVFAAVSNPVPKTDTFAIAVRS
jgi:hypothetical protein